ncbi:hypothetical protein HAX54_047780, partial [Datura stramonium]|nr:hypothetical protein [Datura stramonium]
MAWTRQGRLKNILSVEAVGAEGWHRRWHLAALNFGCENLAKEFSHCKPSQFSEYFVYLQDNKGWELFP